MGWLVGISFVAAYLTFHFLSRTAKSARRGRILRACGSGVMSATSAAFLGAGAILLISYLGYGRLVEEQHVSSIEFRRVSPEEFQARLSVPGEDDRFFILRGDEWQMDARIITWQPPMTILGLDPIYELDRLSGRYAEIDREREEARTVHSLAPVLPTDLWRISRKFPMLTPGIDAHYGTATFVPMAEGARFDVSLSRDALIARPANDAAEQAVGNWSFPGE
jgi:hypothetical protein